MGGILNSDELGWILTILTLRRLSTRDQGKIDPQRVDVVYG